MSMSNYFDNLSRLNGVLGYGGDFCNWMNASAIS